VHEVVTEHGGNAEEVPLPNGFSSPSRVCLKAPGGMNTKPFLLGKYATSCRQGAAMPGQDGARFQSGERGWFGSCSRCLGMMWLRRAVLSELCRLEARTAPGAAVSVCQTDRQESPGAAVLCWWLLQDPRVALALEATLEGLEREAGADVSVREGGGPEAANALPGVWGEKRTRGELGHGEFGDGVAPGIMFQGVVAPADLQRVTAARYAGHAVGPVGLQCTEVHPAWRAAVSSLQPTARAIQKA
jgi:hypothetical protein